MARQDELSKTQEQTLIKGLNACLEKGEPPKKDAIKKARNSYNWGKHALSRGNYAKAISESVKAGRIFELVGLTEDAINAYDKASEIVSKIRISSIKKLYAKSWLIYTKNLGIWKVQFGIY